MRTSSVLRYFSKSDDAASRRAVSSGSGVEVLSFERESVAKLKHSKGWGGCLGFEAPLLAWLCRGGSEFMMNAEGERRSDETAEELLCRSKCWNRKAEMAETTGLYAAR